MKLVEMVSPSVETGNEQRTAMRERTRRIYARGRLADSMIAKVVRHTGRKPVE